MWSKRNENSRLVGLGVWFPLRVREVPGSNPGRALLFLLIKTQQDYIGRELAGRISSLQNKNVLIVSTAFRLIIVALIAMTNCQPRHTPVYFQQDWVYIGMILSNLKVYFWTFSRSDYNIRSGQWVERLDILYYWMWFSVGELGTKGRCFLDDLPYRRFDLGSLLLVSCYFGRLKTARNSPSVQKSVIFAFSFK